MLNQSFVSNMTHNTVKQKINIKDRFNTDPKFVDFFIDYDPAKNLLFMVDGKQNIWEVVTREDLSIDCLLNCENLYSITTTTMAKRNKFEQINDNDQNRLLNIEIKDNHDEKCFSNSEFNISKITDLNISNLMKGA